MKKTTLAAAISAALIAATPLTAMSYEKGDWIVRAGAALVEPDESSSSLRLDGSALPGTGLGVGNDTQLGLTITYMLNEKIGIELLASTPFKHDVTSKGLNSTDVPLGVPDGTKIASVEHLPPTLSLQYFFMDAKSTFQPYAGIGINYWLVLDESLTSDAKTALGASNLNVDDSIGLSFQLGADYQINDQWLINASVWNIDIETKASMDTGLGHVTADLDIDPWVYMIGVGYKF